MSQTTPIVTLKERFRGFLPVVVDVETAGFNCETDALLEVSMMTVSMDEKGFLSPKQIYSANIRPFEGSNLLESNLAFLGIDPFDESRNLKTEREALVPMLKSISKEVKEQACSRAILVGHNGHFDLGFIKAACERLNYKRNPFHNFSVIDTASLSALVYGQTVLARACYAAGYKFESDSAHSSAYDTEMECKLFCAICNKFTTFAGVPEVLIDAPNPKEMHMHRHPHTDEEKE